MLAQVIADSGEDFESTAQKPREPSRRLPPRGRAAAAAARKKEEKSEEPRVPAAKAARCANYRTVALHPEALTGTSREWGEIIGIAVLASYAHVWHACK